MARELRYGDAVRLLGGDSALARSFDELAGVGILAIALAGTPAVLALLDVKTEVRTLAAGLLDRLTERLDRSRGTARTDRVVAAHGVLMLTSFWDSLDEPMALPLRRRETGLLQADVRAEVDRELAAARVQLPDGDAGLLPGPEWSFVENLARIEALFQTLARSVLRLVEGLYVWDRTNETVRQQFADGMLGAVPSRALQRYKESYVRLAAEVPEFFVWASMQEYAAAATRDLRLRSLLVDATTGLEGLRDALQTWPMLTDAPTEAWRALAKRSVGGLDKPVITPSEREASEGFPLPSLRQAYLNHEFRVVVATEATRPAADESWAVVQRRLDLQQFLAAHFTLPRAWEYPLVVLGHPGSGKSILTRMLAGQLPEDLYAVVRVELRSVAADRTLQGQIEQAVEMETGERCTWPELSRSTGGRLPVVLLDGLDELIQNSRTSHTGFLEQVREFQQREAEVDRPVAVVVTSRLIGAETVQFPDGAVVVKLEPFSTDQIRRWIDRWNEPGRPYFTRHHLQPLSWERVEQHADLARQPLLLLLLALYDLDGNALRSGEDFRAVDLYDGLLTSFVRREVRRHAPGASENELVAAVAAELRRLSVVAFAMFNRDRQSVSSDEVDTDLQALGSTDDRHRRQSGELSRAQLLMGRFFFIHPTRATDSSGVRQTYEFLHATFAEYLVARLTLDVLRGLAVAESRRRQDLKEFRPAGPLDDGYLRALLSWSTLTVRAPIVEFLQQLIGRLSDGDRELLDTVLTGLFRRTFADRRPSEWDGYSPGTADTLERLATYDANLFLLCLLIRGGKIAASALTDPAPGTLSTRPWGRHTSLWSAHLPQNGWQSLSQTVLSERTQHDGSLDFSLTLSANPPAVREVGVEWATRLYDWPAASQPTPIVRAKHLASLRRRAELDATPDSDYLLHILSPLIYSDDWFGTVHEDAEGRQALPHTWLKLALGDGSAPARANAYTVALAAMNQELSWPEQCLPALLRRLRDDLPAMPVETATAYLQQVIDWFPGNRRDRRLWTLVAECVRELANHDRTAARPVAAELQRRARHVAAETPTGTHHGGLPMALVVGLVLAEAGFTELVGAREALRAADVRTMTRERPLDALRALRLAERLEDHNWVSDRWVPVLNDLPDNFIRALDSKDLAFLRLGGAPDAFLSNAKRQSKT